MLLAAATQVAPAQTAPQPSQQEQEPVYRVPKVVPVPPLPKSRYTPPPEPTDPPPRNFVDSRTHIAFHLPAGWALSRTDGELSTFHIDARTAIPETTLRAAAGLSFNPYPWSTFAGALFYLSTTAKTTPAECAAQATAKPNQAEPPAVVDDVKFAHGHDEHGTLCTEARDEVLTTYRRGSCVRFDLVINTFCAEPSGSREITQTELENVRKRLMGILESVKLSAK
jgi:hypothetical protein